MRIRNFSLFLALMVTTRLPAQPASNGIQFDFFPGFRDTLVVNQICPLGFEIHSESVPINGRVRIQEGGFGSNNQIIEFPVEIPVGTRKRIQIPFHVSPMRSTMMTAELMDSSGKSLALSERFNLQLIPWPASVFLSVSDQSLRKFSPPPGLMNRPIQGNAPSRSGSQSQFIGDFFNIREFELPDSSLLLSGVSGIHLESSILSRLNPLQIQALMSWVENGGHLVLSLAQPAELTSHPILNKWLMARSTGESRPVGLDPIRNYISDDLNNNLVPYFNFEPSWLTSSGLVVQDNNLNDPSLYIPDIPARQVAVFPLDVPGAEIVGSPEMPLLHHLRSGLGSVTIAAFNFNLSGLEDWDGFYWFWVTSFQTHHQVFSQILKIAATDQKSSGNQFNFTDLISRWMETKYDAIVRSRQIKEIPIILLLFILVVYLVMIGPVDWIVLRKLKRPMLTWITFPSMVVAFSLVIYVVGYIARAGRTEWRAVHLVKVPSRPDLLPTIGQTYAGIYSPVNKNYDISSGQAPSSISGLLNNQINGRIQFSSSGAGFQSSTFIPVWTSQQFKFSWQTESDSLPNVEIITEYSGPDEAPQINIINHSSLNFHTWYCLWNKNIFRIPNPENSRELSLSLDPQSVSNPDILVAPLKDLSTQNDLNQYMIYNQYGQVHHVTETGQMYEHSFSPGDIESFIDTMLQEPESMGAREMNDRIRFNSTESYPPPPVSSPGNAWINAESRKNTILVFGLVDQLNPSPIQSQFTSSYVSELSIFRWLVPVDSPR